jgi:ethanolamine ammonia-lyase small subunit
MKEDKKTSILSSSNTVQDPWQSLRKFTSARIALGRVGSSLPTKEILNFGMAHAMARDAVHLSLDVDLLESQIQSIGFATIKVHSRAHDRASYLLRPDWGRRLDDESTLRLEEAAKDSIDLLLVVADGLSSLAVQKHAVPMLNAITELLPTSWKIGPLVIASQARVALADDIGERMKARMTILLIGERPGLSSPDSLGLYLTYKPKLACSDANRNCISNVRPEGLSYQAAAKKLIWLAQESVRLKLSGVALKDESDVQQIVKDELGMLNKA